MSAGLAYLFVLGAIFYIIVVALNVAKPNLFFYRLNSFHYIIHSQFWYALLFLGMAALSIPVVKKGLLVRFLYSLCWWPFFYFLAGNQLVGDEGYFVRFISNILDKGNDQLTIRIVHKLLFFTGYSNNGITIVLACFGSLYVLGLLQLSKKLNPKGPLGSTFFLLQFSSVATLSFFRDFEVYSQGVLLSTWILLLAAHLSPQSSRVQTVTNIKQNCPMFKASLLPRYVNSIINKDRRLACEFLMTIVICIGIWSNYVNLIFLPVYLYTFISARRWRFLFVQVVFALCFANLLGYVFRYDPWRMGSLRGAGDYDVFVALFRSHTPVEMAIFSWAYVEDILSMFLFLSPVIPLLIVLVAVFARRNNYSPFTLSVAIPALSFVFFCNFDLGVENDYNLIAFGALGVNLLFSETITVIYKSASPVFGRIIASALVLGNLLLFVNVMYRYSYS